MRLSSSNIALKRAYEPVQPADGTRILVERLWPRGISKQKAAIDLWMKDIAPSTELRKWFAHDPKKWPEFQKRYRTELRANKSAVDALKDEIAAAKNVTFIYAAHDPEQNSAVVLKSFLTGKRQ